MRFYDAFCLYGMICAQRTPLNNGRRVTKTFHFQARTLLLFLVLLSVYGCAQKEKALSPEQTVPPDITAAYLLEHRIISYTPKLQEKIIATLPYEIETFEESYLLYLVARIPYTDSSSTLAAAEPRYYLWLQRKSDSWRDFTDVRSAMFSPLRIESHYSAIRKGAFYKDYTVDFTLEQLTRVQDSGLDLLLVNRQNVTSEINIPGHYIRAFLRMLSAPSE